MTDDRFWCPECECVAIEGEHECPVKCYFCGEIAVQNGECRECGARVQG